MLVISTKQFKELEAGFLEQKNEVAAKTLAKALNTKVTDKVRQTAKQILALAEKNEFEASEDILKLILFIGHYHLVMKDNFYTKIFERVLSNLNITPQQRLAFLEKQFNNIKNQSTGA